MGFFFSAQRNVEYTYALSLCLFAAEPGNMGGLVSVGDFFFNRGQGSRGSSFAHVAR